MPIFQIPGITNPGLVDAGNDLGDLADLLEAAAREARAVTEPDLFPDEPGTYSTAMFNEFDYLTSLFASSPDAGGLGISKTQANNHVNAWAGSFYRGFGRWPTVQELLNRPGFVEGAARFLTNLDALPGVFQSESGYYFNTGINLQPVDWLDPTEADFLSRSLPPGESLARFMAPEGTPFVPNEVVQQILGRVQSSGSGSRGSGGMAPFTLDRDAVIENIRGVWRPLMLEEPDNPGSLADAFIREVKAFRRKGGSLDLQTWVKKQMRGTPRYKQLYAKRPEALSEEDYIGGFTQVARGFGFREGVADQFIEAGAEAGAGLEGFATQVSRSREASLTSRFAQRMARATASLGALAAS